MMSGRQYGRGDESAQGRFPNAGRTRRGKGSPARASEDAWNQVMERLDSRLLRRARTALKQNEIGSIKVENHRIMASVKRKGPDKRLGVVSVPLVDDWQAYRRSVATWFCQRPDWLAALLAGEWDVEFLSFLEGTGLRLFPSAQSVENWLLEAACGCDDWETPCRHVAALVLQIAEAVQDAPYKALAFVGLSLDDIMDEAHELTALQCTASGEEPPQAIDGWTGLDIAQKQGEASADFNTLLWTEELTVFGLRSSLTEESVSNPVNPSKTNLSTIVPTISTQRVSELSARYLPVTVT